MRILRWLRRLGRRRPGHAPRGRRLSLECLEDRALPSGLSFQFQIDDPGRQFAPYPLMQRDLDAAGQVYSGLLDGQGTIQILVRPDNTIPRSDGSTIGVAPAGSAGGVTVVQNAPLALARTGVNPNGTGPVAELDFNTTYLRSVWFDPSGAARTGTVPAGKTDFISVALHELMHALGFQGYRAINGPGYAGMPAGVASSFDALTSFGSGPQAGVLFFRGPLAMAAYGGPVPLTSVGPYASLTSQNFYHVGNPVGLPGAALTPDLMNGMVFATGTRYRPSALDLAMLADMGWSVPGVTPPPTPVVSPQFAAPPAARKRVVHRPPHHVRHLVRPRARHVGPVYFPFLFL